MNRRGFLTGVLATLAAPAIVRTAGLLMPVRSLRPLLPYRPPSQSLQALIDLLMQSNAILDEVPWMMRDGMVFGQSASRIQLDEDGALVLRRVPLSLTQFLETRLS